MIIFFYYDKKNLNIYSNNYIMDDKNDKIETNDDKKVAKKYCCISCDYITSRKCNFNKHLNGLKHQRMTNDDDGGQKVAKSSKKKQPFICDCGRSYKHRQGIWKHKQECNIYTDNSSNKNSSNKLNSCNYVSDKELIMMLIKDNNELKKMMMEQQSLIIENNIKVIDLCKGGTHNTTNTHTNYYNKSFSLNVFLNETCKNAMNIMDFAESIQLQLTDLENIGQVGYIEGISSIIVKNLKALDITKRPIHCPDKKREVIYIKDEDKWEREDPKNIKIKKVIHKIAFKNQRLLPKFKEAHPGCNMSESKYSDQYSKIVIEAMGGAGNNDEEKIDKIVRNITKEVTINKKLKVDELVI